MTPEVMDATPVRVEAGVVTTAPAPADGFWGSYALAVLQDVHFGPDIVDYLERIEATLQPYGGRFLVHAAPFEQVEGASPGDPVVIGFPGRTGAHDWYHSPEYQALVPLRADHSDSRVFLVEGVDAAHRSADVVDLLRRTGS